MRNLTQQEIDDKPEWATHYIFGTYDVLIWDSEFIDSANNSSICPAKVKPPELFGTDGSKPIPRKEFDISEYEFSDSNIAVVMNASNRIKIRSNYSAGVFLSSRDAIAIAKHFKLTESDLK